MKAVAQAVQQVLHTYADQLFRLPNVVGAGLGSKERGGEVLLSEGPVLVVLVEKKLPREALRSRDLVPPRLGGVATDVIPVGTLRLLSGRTDRLRPARPGCSIGHRAITAGTFGAVVRDRQSGEPLILSNNHVLANLTDGTDARASVGDAIYQPGAYDGGTDQDIIATLLRYVPLWRDATAPQCLLARAAAATANTVLRWLRQNYQVRVDRLSGRANLADAAVAKPIRPGDIAAGVLGLGPVRGTAPAELGMAVTKSGRTTGVTEGTVRVVGATVRVGLGEAGSATFEDQIVTTAMAQPGDSGSLLLSADHRAVGLLSAGSDQATIHGRLEHVLSLLEVDVVAEPPA